MANLHKLNTLIPLEELEQEAQNQIYDALDLPFLKRLAIMPDCHTGYSLPIGGVALLDGVISPEYTGFDIGCGMCMARTDIPASDLNDELKKDIFNEIYKRVPVGFNSREKSLDYEEFKSASGNKELNKKVLDRLYIQLGTLGSGNHFIELGESRDGYVCVTIHSGSRNIGHSIASYYMRLSRNEEKDLPNGFFNVDGEFGKMYYEDMVFAQEYALSNRVVMLGEVMSILGITKLPEFVNENHNHAIITEDGVLHRKGATPADKGQIGVIPGNMKDGVYVTVGLGNEEYLSSASHGAGRRFSRRKAKETISISDFENDMKGIVCKVDNGTLDESPSAYKDINMVIERQEGIVIEVVDYLKPLVNIKG